MSSARESISLARAGSRWLDTLVSPKTAEDIWRGEPLPRGRHKLARAAVRDSQRERLLRAIVELVAEHGYEHTTVPMVVATARVSRNAFYELFEDKVDCFLAASDRAAADVLTALMALADQPDWIGAVVDGARIYARWWQDRPAQTLAYFVGLQDAGARAVAQRERSYRAFETMFEQLGRWARVQEPMLEPLHVAAPRAIVLSVTDLVARQVRAGAVARLDQLTPEIVYLTVKLLADESHARAAVARA
jgi:AcrR family transcriptional regulator